MHKWGYQKIFNQQLLERRVLEKNKYKKHIKNQLINGLLNANNELNELNNNIILDNKLSRTNNSIEVEFNDKDLIKNNDIIDDDINTDLDEILNNNFNNENMLKTEVINEELKKYNLLSNNSINTDFYTEDLNLENEFQKFENVSNNEIDIVYTWVNSNDQEWKNKKKQFIKNKSNNIKDGDNIGRYSNNDELLYSIRSIIKHLSWIRNIYIVTDNQIPSWFNKENPKIKIIDHKDIFENINYLPTFNSVAIEMNLYRIPGLSEYFIYLNDDCLFGNNMRINDFITKDGKIIMRFQKNKFTNLKINNTDSSFRIGHKNASKLISKLFGHHSRLTISHQAFILRKSIFIQLEKLLKNEMNQTRSNRFRSINDVQPIALHNYFAQETGLGVGLYENNSLYYGITDKTTINDIKQIFNFIINNRPKYICINDARNNKQNNEVMNLIKKYYNYIYPNKSICEL
jgi:hypothetical protein